MNVNLTRRTWFANTHVAVTDVPRVTVRGVEYQPVSVTFTWTEWNLEHYEGPEVVVYALRVRKDGSVGVQGKNLYPSGWDHVPEWITELVEKYTPKTFVTWED